VSNKFSLEWPKKSGIVKEYPEIDRAAWFDPEQAKKKIHKGQIAFIDRLIEMQGGGTKGREEFGRPGSKLSSTNMQRPGSSKQFELTDESNDHDLK
jgi:hypothetical protein